MIRHVRFQGLLQSTLKFLEIIRKPEGINLLDCWLQPYLLPGFCTKSLRCLAQDSAALCFPRKAFCLLTA